MGGFFLSLLLLLLLLLLHHHHPCVLSFLLLLLFVIFLPSFSIAYIYSTKLPNFFHCYQLFIITDFISMRGRNCRCFTLWLRNCWAFFNVIFNTMSKFHLLSFVLLIVYTLIGGAVFYAFESDHYQQQHSNFTLANLNEKNEQATRMLDHLRKVFALKMWKVGRQAGAMSTKFARSRAIWKWYEQNVENVTEFCQSTNQQPNKAAVDWSFWSSVYYAVTVYTTIGYGDMTPSTTSGKILTMIYALCGIPLICYILQDWGWLEFGDLPISVALFMVIFLLCISASMFLIWEDELTYFESDIVPKYRISMAMCIVPVLMGLATVSMTINLVQKLEYQKKQTDPNKSLMNIESDEDVMTRLKHIGDRMSFESRFLFRMLNRSQRRLLEECWERRVKTANAASQTVLLNTEEESQTSIAIQFPRRNTYVYNAE
ncbi:Potassium channel subfamily K member 18 [Trichinella pseudospiralis]|uniref:Potassium channel subfamily K member 18 n=1 Tax=Trichinella pseudospiralis TaxID=6337 RepID=A0A0V1G375_TRIPS|nr:Potassium channel subfamily K member 18 [Trichinella pseudospiralis]